MEKIRILNRFGIWETKEWSYNPEENLNAKEKAYQKLKELGIQNAIVYEVAPEVFWYSTSEQKINCGGY